MPCCPTRPRSPEASRQSFLAKTADQGISEFETVSLNAARFKMGTSETILPQDGEKPSRSVRVGAFSIMTTTVTNTQFAKFVNDTGFMTEVRYLRKGGSFLCHKYYCYRYSVAARSSNTPNITTPHTGFRLVWDGQDVSRTCPVRLEDNTCF